MSTILQVISVAESSGKGSLTGLDQFARSFRKNRDPFPGYAQGYGALNNPINRSKAIALHESLAIFGHLVVLSQERQLTMNTYRVNKLALDY
jgi:hypothetical protein